MYVSTILPFLLCTKLLMSIPFATRVLYPLPEKSRSRMYKYIITNRIYLNYYYPVKHSCSYVVLGNIHQPTLKNLSLYSFLFSLFLFIFYSLSLSVLKYKEILQNIKILWLYHWFCRLFTFSFVTMNDHVYVLLSVKSFKSWQEHNSIFSVKAGKYRLK